MNGTNSGSDNGTNNTAVQKRIRLTSQECKIIYEALRVYDELPENPGSIPELIKRIERIWEGKPKRFSWSEMHDLRRRFSALSTDDGFYARRSR